MDLIILLLCVIKPDELFFQPISLGPFQMTFFASDLDLGLDLQIFLDISLLPNTDGVVLTVCFRATHRRLTSAELLQAVNICGLTR